MPFIPHTEQDIQEMLKTIGVEKIEQLFDEIPKSLRHKSLDGLPQGINEMELTQLMKERAALDDDFDCFIGAGAYEHFIPAAVWQVATRGEWMTAYTPYQAEASQGSLQLIYEFQTMMASLMGLEVSNASLYDGASSLAEAVLMCVRLAKGEARSILVPKSLHPFYRQAVTTIVKQQKIELIEIPYVDTTGKIDMAALEALHHDKVAGLVIPQPNFFGVLDDVDTLTDWAKEKNILSIGVVNPMSMALLKPPGEWGHDGADIACGEGQPLGIPLAAGGPYYGFLCCKKKYIRQMPGRIVGKTEDKAGKTGYVLTLQAREQHIRRAKATSNICTNQGLMVTASTIYMSLLGPVGLRNVAIENHLKANALKSKLTQIKEVVAIFESAYFNEFVIKLPIPATLVLDELAKIGIQAGFALEAYYPTLKDCLLVCATETKTEAQIEKFAKALDQLITQKKIDFFSKSA